MNTDNMNDIVLRGIALAEEEGRCWACGLSLADGHALGCPDDEPKPEAGGPRARATTPHPPDTPEEGA